MKRGDIPKVPKKPYASVHVPRSAGTSVRRTIRWWDKLMGIDTQAMGSIHPEVRGHLPAWKLIDVVGEKRWSEIESFSFIRNTYDRVVSCWFYVGKRMRVDLNDPDAFRRWVQCGMPSAVNGHSQYQLFAMERFGLNLTSSQLVWILPHENYTWITSEKPLVKHIFSFESLQSDWATLQTILGIEDVAELPHENKSEREVHPISWWYDIRTRNLVADIYRDEIEYFEFEFEER